MRICLGIAISLGLAVPYAHAADSGEQRFALVAAGAEVYRLNTNSGELVHVTPDAVKPIRQEPYPLSIGTILRQEDGTLLKYQGGGKFGPAVTVSNW